MWRIKDFAGVVVDLLIAEVQSAARHASRLGRGESGQISRSRWRNVRWSGRLLCTKLIEVQQMYRLEYTLLSSMVETALVSFVIMDTRTPG